MLTINYNDTKISIKDEDYTKISLLCKEYITEPNDLSDEISNIDTINNIKDCIGLDEDFDNEEVFYDICDLFHKQYKISQDTTNIKNSKSTKNKPYTTVVNDIKYIVLDNIVINSKNGSKMTLKEFEDNILKNDKKGSSTNRFKDIWDKLTENETEDIFQSVHKNIDNFEIFTEDIGLTNENNYTTKSKISIIIDKTDLNNSFIFRNYIETKKDGNIVNNMNSDGFTPYSIKNGITNTMLFYGNIMDKNPDILKALNFINCGDGVYINENDKIICDLSSEMLYFKEISKENEHKKKKQIKVFTF